jgi:predicted lipopolysaccharide heptosyltransferase III
MNRNIADRQAREANISLLNQKILIIKLQYVGDTMGVIPTVANLKKHAPGVRVDVLIHKESAALIAFSPDISKVWEYDRRAAKQGLFSTVFYHLKLIGQLRREQYDVVIALTQGDRAAFLSFATGAPLRLIYKSSNKVCNIVMNAFADVEAQRRHFIEHDVDILSYFGIENREIDLRVRIPDPVRSKIREQLRGNDGGRINVVIHPGARKRTRQWPSERFAEIARRLHEYDQVSIILLGGPGDEDLLGEIESRMGFKAAFRSCELSLLEMAAVFSECHLFIGNDSGPGHIAAAVGCATLTLFGPNYPDSCRPYIPLGEVIFKNLPCCGCRQEEDRCVRPDNTCMDLIEVNEVWEKVKMMLSRTSSVSPP